MGGAAVLLRNPPQGTPIPPATIESGLRYLPARNGGDAHEKALAILAAVATIGATTVTAPAQARGIGPAWRSGWRRARWLPEPPAPTDMGTGTGRIMVMGRAMATTVRLLRARLLRRLLRWRTLRLLRSPLLWAPLLAPLVIKKSPERCSGLFYWLRKTWRREAPEALLTTRTAGVQIHGGHFMPGVSSVATKYSSRSRLNFSCVALKLAMRVMISCRSRAALSGCSVMPILFDSRPMAIDGRELGRELGRGVAGL